jgi:hypothetical protein
MNYLQKHQSSYRISWRLFKVQLWCIFVLHKLILIVAKYAVLLS